MDDKSKEEAVESLLADMEIMMEELFQSGFHTVHNSTMEALQEITKRTAQYGMAYLSNLLETFCEGLAMRRHKIVKEADGLAELYVKLNEYLYWGRQQIAYDRGRNLYLSSTDNHIC